MDCEKFEDAILDELYGELDEVTSAAVRRHASTCAKCGERLASMKATRSVLATALAPEPVPAGLEDRILAAAARAPIVATTNVTPMRSRGARFVSMAGRWAMRPQTAMAAVFLLMIGFSVVLVKSPSMRSDAAVTVTERGAPAENAAEAPATTATSDLAAAQAHGPEGRPMASVAAAPTALPQAESRPFESAKEVAPSVAASAVAMADREERKREDGFGNAATGRSSRAAAGPGQAQQQGLPREEPMAMATPPAAPPPSPKPAARAAAAPMDDSVAGAAPAKRSEGDRAGGGGGGDFATAMASYRGRRFSEATKQFDALAGQGDQSAALWAARSERDGSGCASAVPRYQRLATSAWGTSVGYDATLELGRCFRAMGSFESARGQFARLLTVPSHAARAQAELDAMNPVRAKAASPPAATQPNTEAR